MFRLRVARAAAIAAVLATLSCRDEAAPAPPPPAASTPARTDARAKEPAALILYPNAPNTLWGAAQFFDPDRSRPATKVEHGPVTTTAGLAPELIERVMRDKENELLYCYWGILKDKPGLQGRVVISAKVGPDGKVVSAVDKGSDIASPNLILCVAKTLEAGELAFPPTGVAGTFVYTLTFSPQ
jgi:hypothetical protein